MDPVTDESVIIVVVPRHNNINDATELYGLQARHYLHSGSIFLLSEIIFNFSRTLCHFHHPASQFLCTRNRKIHQKHTLVHAFHHINPGHLDSLPYFTQSPLCHHTTARTSSSLRIFTKSLLFTYILYINNIYTYICLGLCLFYISLSIKIVM